MADVVRELPSEVVVRRVEVPERPATVERCRERTGDAVVGEVETYEAGKAADGVRDGACGVDAGEAEARYAPSRVAPYVRPAAVRVRGRGGGGIPCREHGRVAPLALDLEEQLRVIHRPGLRRRGAQEAAR